MKLFFIVVLVYLFLSLQVQAQSQFALTIGKMEKSLFGIQYDNQEDSQRLKRLEESVYGKVSSTSIALRVEKLSKDLSADVIGQEIKPKRDTFTDEDDMTAYKEDIPKADPNVSYPIVDNLEKTVFNKEFKTMEINKRLSNLEQNVFKKSYFDDLNSRVERLKLAIAPAQTILEKQKAREDAAGDYNYYGPDDANDSYTTGAAAPDDILSKNVPGQDWLSQNPKNAFVPNYNRHNSVLNEYNGTSDVTVGLSALEKSMLRRSYPDDIVSNRLTRLEAKMFSSNFSDDDEQTRLERLSSAYQAKKSSKRYDNNKFSQHAATAMQIGAILLMILAAVI